MRARVRTIFSALSSSSSHKGIISLFDQGASSLTNFLTGVIIGRNCLQEEFGLYMLCYSTILLVADIQMSLISSPYMVFSQRLSGRHLARYTGSIFVHQLVLSAFLIVLLIIGALLFEWFPFFAGMSESDSYISVLRTLAVTITFILFRDYIRKVCFALFHMFSALLIDVSSGILQLAGLFILARMGLLSAAKAFAVIGAACAATSLLWFYVNRSLFSVNFRQSLVDFKKNWIFSRWVFLSGILWALGMTLYPWVLTLFHGTAANGVWGACFAIAALGNPLTLGIQNYLGPKVVQAYSRGGLRNLWRFVLKASFFFCLIMLPFCLVLFFFGETLLTLIYGSKYAGNGTVVAVLSFNILFLAATYATSRAFLAMERSDLFFVGNIVPLLVMVTVGLLLVKHYGPLGVALALLIGSGVTSMVMFLLFANVLRKAEEKGG